MLRLRHVCPNLVVQWLYILILLERCPLQVWAKVLNTGRQSTTSSRLAGGETAEPCNVVGLEMVRRAGLAVMANHLVEHTSEGELLAWFLSSQTKAAGLTIFGSGSKIHPPHHCSKCLYFVEKSIFFSHYFLLIFIPYGHAETAS
jgi:hypothetical protein